MNQTPSDPPVTVKEGVDGFKLRVSDACLRDRWYVVAINKLAEVTKEVIDPVLWRRYELGTEGGIITAT